MKYTVQLPDTHGAQLEVLQQLPSKGDKFPTVIFVSGIGADLHEFGLFGDLSLVLNKNGMQTFRFSFAGTGKSTGSYTQTTLSYQAEQLKTVLDYVLKDRFTQTDRIAILGHGFGVNVVLAAQPLTGIKTYIFSNLMVDPEDTLVRWFRGEHGYNPDGVSKRIRSDKSPTKIGPGFWHDLKSHDSFSSAKLIRAPVLLVHGSNSRVSKPYEAQELFNHIPTRKKFMVIRGANQGYTHAARIVVEQLIVDWLLETLSISSTG